MKAKKFVPFTKWVEERFFDPTSVNQFGNDWDFSKAALLKLEPYQKRICDHVLTPLPNGEFPYSTVVYSTIKKEGKTTLAGAIGAWYAECINPPNYILTLANDQEQSAGRIFAAMLPTFYAAGYKVPLFATSKPEVRLSNGTIVQAIPNNYAGAAGGNYGLTLWSELWGYTSERSRRLFEELIPVPTRFGSLRWIETYVGFEDESHLLLHLFKRIFVDTDEKEIQKNAVPVPGLEDITTDGKPTCWHIPEEGLFYYHNHTPRMSWNTGERGEKYRREQKADLRPSQYLRLHENRWQSSEGSFILDEKYNEAVTLSGPEVGPMVLAADASQRNDTIALVGVQKRRVNYFGKIHERYRLMFVQVFNPKDFRQSLEMRRLGAHTHDMNLMSTLGASIKSLYEKGLIIGPVFYDPYQLHQVAIDLRQDFKIPCMEFNQNLERLKADTFLMNKFNHNEIDLFPHDILESHVKGAKAKEFDNEQIRIVKGTISNVRKIDAAVALSMAVWKASELKWTPEKKKQSSSYSIFN